LILLVEYDGTVVTLMPAACPVIARVFAADGLLTAPVQ
jgi:hypothetical protein